MNTATIMDMMFNTEMIVKDMKGGKEDMTEKQLRYMRAFVVGSSEFIIDDNATHERLKRYGIVDRLNEQHELIEYLKPLANENTQYIADMEDDIATFKEEIKELTDTLNQRTQQLDDYGLKVQETLQGHYDFARNKKDNCDKNDLICHHCYRVLKASIEEITEELGVELNDKTI